MLARFVRWVQLLDKALADLADAFTGISTSIERIVLRLALLCLSIYGLYRLLASH